MMGSDIPKRKVTELSLYNYFKFTIILQSITWFILAMTWQNNKHSSAFYRPTSHLAKDGGKINPQRSKVKVSKGGAVSGNARAVR